MAVQKRMQVRHEDVFPAGAFLVGEVTDLTVLPYVDDNGARPRIAWSFRAAGMTAPGKSNRPTASGAGGDSGKAA